MIPLIAEIGLAHDGSLWLAHSYIDAVAAAGATHVKFQAHTPRESSPEETWRREPPTGESRMDYWFRTSFTVDQWASLAGHAHAKGLAFGLSIFHDSLVESLAPFCDFLKVPSGAVHYEALLEAYRIAHKPTYISDGLSRIVEPTWTRLICTSKYPTPLSECGVNEIHADVDGLSDHTGNPLTAALATFAGAVAVEVHVTFDKRTGLPDAAASLTLDELEQAARGMQQAQDARLGTRPSPDATMRERFGYGFREGRWCKPAA